MRARSRSRSDAGRSAMSLLEAALPSDSEALRAFAMALPAELYARTAHLEKLKAQLVMLKGARYGHSSVKPPHAFPPSVEDALVRKRTVDERPATNRSARRWNVGADRHGRRPPPRVGSPPRAGWPPTETDRSRSIGTARSRRALRLCAVATAIATNEGSQRCSSGKR